MSGYSLKQAFWMLGCVVLQLAPVGSTLAATHYAKLIKAIEPPHGAADCVYFQLHGVTEADAVVPNEAWIAVPRSDPGMKEIYALLLSAKMSGSTVHVVTTGQVAGACGNFVRAQTVFLSD